jgi:hypothetical protein
MYEVEPTVVVVEERKSISRDGSDVGLLSDDTCINVTV